MLHLCGELMSETRRNTIMILVLADPRHTLHVCSWHHLHPHLHPADPRHTLHVCSWHHLHPRLHLCLVHVIKSFLDVFRNATRLLVALSFIGYHNLNFNKKKASQLHFPHARMVLDNPTQNMKVFGCQRLDPASPT